MALIVEAALKRKQKLEKADMALCTTLLLEKLHAPVISDTIYVDERGRMVLRGKPVKNPDTQKAIMESCRAAQSNIALKLVHEKIEYAAAVEARKAVDPNDLLFTKAALWVLQAERKVFEDIAGAPGDSGPDDADDE